MLIRSMLCVSFFLGFFLISSVSFTQQDSENESEIQTLLDQYYTISNDNQDDGVAVVDINDPDPLEAVSANLR